MKKLFTILLMMLGIHMNAVAQEHLFPEVTFTYQGETYTVPAWDAKCAKGERVQSTFEKTTPDEVGDRVAYNGIIVATACGISSSTGRPVGDFSEGDITIGENTYTAAEVTYGDIFPGMNEALGAEYLFSKATITDENYSIPESASAFENDGLASLYNIVGIGDCAYANKTWSHEDNTVFMQVLNLTIPVHIKTLGKYAFFANGYMKDAFTAAATETSSGSEIKVFPEGLFADCMRLKRTRLPFSLERVESHALGGCKVLRLIYFGDTKMARTTPPVMAADACRKYEGSTATDFLDRKGTGTGKHYCEGWAYNHEVVRKCREESFWNDFCFRIPSNMPASGYKSFYSDLILWKYYPKDNGEDDVVMGTYSMEFLYYNKNHTDNPTGGNGSYTVNLYKLGDTSRPKNMALILHGSSDNIYVSPVTTSYKDYQYLNYLYGDVNPINMDQVIADNPDDNVYVLKNGQFRRCSGGTLGEYKAYLKLSKNLFGRNEAKELDIVIVDEDGETNDIKSINNSQLTIDNNMVYDLQGRSVSTNSLQDLPKGMYIMNGKKFVIK